jgi:signal transduction histidine kinase
MNREGRATLYTLAPAVLVPAALIVLIRSVPGMDPMLPRPVFHFYIVSLTSVVAVVVAAFFGLVVGVRSFAVFALAMAFVSIGAIFTIHGLTTPGILTTELNPAITWSAFASVFSGAIFLLIAALAPSERSEEVRTRLRGVVFVAWLALYLVLVFLAIRGEPLFPNLQNKLTGSGAIYPIVSFLVFGAAIAAAGIRHARRPSWVWRLVLINLVLLALAQLCQTFEVWKLSWWLYHVFMLIAFVVTVIVLVARYEELRSFRLVRYYIALGSVVIAGLALAGTELVLAVALPQELAASAEVSVPAVRLRVLALITVSLVLFGAALLLVVVRGSHVISSRTEELRAAYEELRASEAQRDELMQMIVHDLQNPLTSISGNLQLAEMELGSTEDLRRARESTTTMSRMVQTLLYVHRMERQEFSLELADVPVRETVEGVLAEYQGAATQEGLSLELTEGEERRIRGDQEMLRRVIENLVSNAIKYSPESGAIRARVASRDGGAQVDVEDRGTGVPEEAREAIFTKYYQSRVSRGARRGIGLGLTFCKMAVELHGGSITAEPADPHGTRFSFWIPDSPPRG